MRVAPIRYVTEADYLEGEKRSEVRHEYVDGIVYAMTGASRRHNGIVGAVYRALHGAARANGCRAYVEAVKLRVEASRSYYYPDVILSCRDESDDYFVSQPCALFEVESRETALVDRREKRRAYTSLETLREYIIVSQDEIAATVFRRAADDSGWIEELLGPGDTLHISCLALDIPLDTLYDDL